MNIFDRIIRAVAPPARPRSALEVLTGRRQNHIPVAGLDKPFNAPEDRRAVRGVNPTRGIRKG